MQERIASQSPDAAVTLRTNLKPGDIGSIVHLHGVVYARECRFDHTFEAYVAGPLSEFVRSASPRGRIWIAERDGKIVGCIAIVPVSQEIGQLRWYLVVPSARGAGLGKKLLHEAIAFSRDCGNKSVILWTVSSLVAAAHLYESVGFKKVEEKPGRQWDVDVVEEKYELILK
ncbi:MAG: GNAT family N-acetyltransferase [Ignavibacteria bacterium]|nr:GNAT family N-acetyltransferase [Ignavibacteria bacterium]